MQVTLGGGGGGGGGARQSAEDLADLFELELDQNKNQYETLQRGEMNKGSQAVDEALQKLKELAERQQKLMQRRTEQQQKGGPVTRAQPRAQNVQKEHKRSVDQLDKR